MNGCAGTSLQQRKNLLRPRPPPEVGRSLQQSGLHKNKGLKERPLGMYILGINAYHGNASAAIVSDGQLVAAVEEERFNRVKYAAGFPVAAIRYCLSAAG